jgi:ELWxxDGT repeat protein/VCBS repeat-containing protein
LLTEASPFFAAATAAGVEVHKPIVEMNGVAYFAGRIDAGDFKLWRSNGTASGTYQVKDVAVATTADNPGYFTNVSGTLFFRGDDGLSGSELWKTDGTAAGTVLVKDVWPGNPGSAPRRMANVNGTLFFTAFDGGGLGLWKSDGTAAGTVLLTKSITLAIGAASFPQHASVNGIYFFRASDGAHGTELWKSDGTTAGTVMVKDIRPGSSGSGLNYLMNVNGQLFFTANDGINGYDLWKSDGTAAGTVVVKDIGAASPGPRYVTAVGGTLFFSAFGRLWKSDGTAAGTAQIGPSASANPRSLTNVSGTLLFSADDGGPGLGELWRSDGTTAGTVLVKDVVPGASVARGLRYLTNVNGTVFFSTGSPAAGIELWKSDGTTTGTVLVKGFGGGLNGPLPSHLANVGGRLFFASDRLPAGALLWTSDGTESGTNLVEYSDSPPPDEPLTAKLLKDINLATAGVTVHSPIVEMNGIAFFPGRTDEGPFRLWRSDGTSAGTTIVHNVSLGSTTTSRRIVNINGTLFFQANDGITGYELWRSDGTESGTVLVKDVFSGSASSNPIDFVNVNGELFFTVGFSALWKSDGTGEGTVQVKNVFPSDLTNVNGMLFFRANDVQYGEELWKSDGTETGTVLVKDVRPGPTGSLLRDLRMAGDTLFFVADDGVIGAGLWKSDGTPAGTVLVHDLSPATSGFPAALLTVVGPTIYFVANDGINGSELWKSDGTSSGTALVRDIWPGATGSSPSRLTNVNGTLFFLANTLASGLELLRTDGTADGTVFIKDIRSGASGSNPSQLTNVDGTLFFIADDGINGRELWKSDGTSAGTILVKDMFAGSEGFSDPTLTPSSYFANVNGKLFFGSTEGSSPRQLWASDGTSGGTKLVARDTSSTTSSSPSAPLVIGSIAYFIARDAEHGNELWRTDGTAAGTTLVKDIAPGPTSSHPRSLTNLNGTLFFTVDTPFETGLWRSDGTAAGTVLVKQLLFSATTSMVNVAGTLFFQAADIYTGTELWKSDGTTTGTVLVKDIRPGLLPSSIVDLTNVNGTLFFRAYDGVTGLELWKSDGTAAGTVLVKDIVPGSSPLNVVRFLTNVNGTLFFAANNDVNGDELWKSDGTSDGTILVKDIRPGASSSSPTFLTNVNGTLFFRASNSFNDFELWRSDGTSAGTILVKDIFSGGSGSQPRYLTNVNGSLFFTAVNNASFESATGYELWKSDGTDAGTILVKDIWPGASSSQPRYLTDLNRAQLANVNGMLIFSANDGTSGLEIWKSDGTSEGTVRIGDIAPGSASSAPNNFAVLGDQLLFAANDVAHGRELWTLVSASNSPPLAANDSYTVAEDAALAIAVSGVLSNDTDAENDALIAILVAGPAPGTFALNASGGFTYTPPANFSGIVSFTYRVSDGEADSNIATVSITVESVNDAPVAVADQYELNEDSALSSLAPGVLDNDSDPDGEVDLTALLVAAPAHGSLFLGEEGSFLYTPQANFAGLDSFTYRVSDGTELSNIATVTFTVVPVNDIPVARNDSYAASEDSVLTVSAPGVLANDQDVESGDALVAILETGPLNGNLALGADGSLIYVPATNFNGLDSFTYRASDSQAASELATVLLSVTAVNDRPALPSRPGALISEGAQFFALGFFVDPDSGDSWTATVDYGDGTGPQPLNLAVNKRFQLSHTYTDDGVYPVTVEVVDSGGLTGRQAFQVHVLNTPPLFVTLTGPDSGSRGQTLQFGGGFRDQGLADTHTATIDWGDGTSTPAAIAAAGSGTWHISAAHAYAAGGVYQVMLTVTDDDGGAASAATSVRISGIGLRGGVLEIVGTQQRDVLTIGQSRGKVQIAGTLGGARISQAFALGSVARIAADLGAGNDSLTAGGAVRVPLLINGGAGNDALTAGNGPAVLLGGDGNDVLRGGGGRDVLIGGAGADQVSGGGGSDLVIAGRTAYDDNRQALIAIHQEWTSARTLNQRMLNLRDGVGPILSPLGVKLKPSETVFEDAEVDALFGGGDLDWFLLDLASDKAKDKKAQEAIG